jgi:hypothetical protein
LSVALGGGYVIWPRGVTFAISMASRDGTINALIFKYIIKYKRVIIS